MVEELSYLIAKALTAIFKKRPYIAFFIFLGLFVIGLGIWIFAAKTPDERIFPIIALVFVLIVLAWYTRLVIKRWDVINQPTPSQPKQMPVQEPELTSVEPPAAGAKSSVQALHVIFGALAAVVISAPLVLIASFGMSVSPIIAEEEVEGFAIMVGVLLCLLIPLAAGLGGLLGAVFTRRSKVRTNTRLTWTALLVGGLTGFILGLFAMIVFYLLASAPV